MRIKPSKLIILTVLLVISILALNNEFSFAQTSVDNYIDPFIDQYAVNASAWEAPLKGFAQNIFWLLALIEIVWVIKDLAIGQASFRDWLFLGHAYPFFRMGKSNHRQL